MPTISFGAALGSLIREKRKSQSLTQTQLAEDAYGSAGKTRRISELESGSVANPHPKTIDPIIVALGISDSEMEACAKRASFEPDQDLDRAYREARNLIDSIAKQFEHTRPSASLAELDEFLKSKAREWAALRDRIRSLDDSTGAVSALIGRASDALANGDFLEVDRVLAEAEDLHQSEVTIAAVRKQAEIRIMRGDSQVLAGNPDSALPLYLAAAEMFSPFSKEEMSVTLHMLAYKLYEASRRSLKPVFLVAARLLERALELDPSDLESEHAADTHYRLSLIYRNAIATSDADARQVIGNRSLEHARKSVELRANSSVFDLSSAKIALANCLLDGGVRERRKDLLNEAVSILEEAISSVEDDEYFELSGHAHNTLGMVQSELNLLDGEKRSTETIQKAIFSFQSAIRASEYSSTADVWAAAMGNLGRALTELSEITPEDSEEYDPAFLRVRAISAYSASLETYPLVAFPPHVVDVNMGLGRVLVHHAATLPPVIADQYLSRAMSCFTIADRLSDRRSKPGIWAHIKETMGRILELQSQNREGQPKREILESALSNYESALDCYRGLSDQKSIGSVEQAISRVRGDLEAS